MSDIIPYSLLLVDNLTEEEKILCGL